jgi:hypothetical protein
LGGGEGLGLRELSFAPEPKAFILQAFFGADGRASPCLSLPEPLLSIVYNPFRVSEDGLTWVYARTLILSLLTLALTARLAAADFEIGPQDSSVSEGLKPAPAARPSLVPAGAITADYPVRLDAGDVPTAYGLPKYGLLTDLRFYDGGGILTKVYLGLHPRLFIGGAADLRNAVGSGPLAMDRDDYQLLARLVLVQEDESLPALALGYDGPAYEHGAARGLYLSVSKEFPTSLAYFQAHAGLNSGQVDTFRADRDLRASAALTTAIHQVGAFAEVDEMMDPVGPRFNAGLEYNFSPIVVAVELRDLGGSRPGVPVSRLLRLSYTGQL